MTYLEIEDEIFKLNKRIYNIHNVLTTEIITLPEAIILTNQIESIKNDLDMLINGCLAIIKKDNQKYLLTSIRRCALVFIATFINPFLGLGTLAYQLIKEKHHDNKYIPVISNKYLDTNNTLDIQAEYLGLKTLYYLNGLNPLDDSDDNKLLAAQLSIRSLCLINNYIKTGIIKPEDELFIDSAIVILQYELDSDCNNIYELLELFKERYAVYTAELLLKRTNQ